eukprot:scaffold324_cov394-Prasinococcus_capsulatus_cf.AAC.4
MQTSTEQLIEEIREDARLYKVYNKYSPSTVLEKIRQIQQNKVGRCRPVLLFTPIPGAGT